MHFFLNCVVDLLRPSFEVEGPGDVGHVPLPFEIAGLDMVAYFTFRVPQSLHGRGRVHRLHQHICQVSFSRGLPFLASSTTKGPFRLLNDFALRLFLVHIFWQIVTSCRRVVGSERRRCGFCRRARGSCLCYPGRLCPQQPRLC